MRRPPRTLSSGTPSGGASCGAWPTAAAATWTCTRRPHATAWTRHTPQSRARCGARLTPPPCTPHPGGYPPARTPPRNRARPGTGPTRAGHAVRRLRGRPGAGPRRQAVVRAVLPVESAPLPPLFTYSARRRSRKLLRLKPEVAPYRAAVLPLLKSRADQVAFADDVFQQLASRFRTELDLAGSIGACVGESSAATGAGAARSRGCGGREAVPAAGRDRDPSVRDGGPRHHGGRLGHGQGSGYYASAPRGRRRGHPLRRARHRAARRRVARHRVGTSAPHEPPSPWSRAQSNQGRCAALLSPKVASVLAVKRVALRLPRGGAPASHAPGFQRRPAQSGATSHTP